MLFCREAHNRNGGSAYRTFAGELAQRLMRCTRIISATLILETIASNQMKLSGIEAFFCDTKSVRPCAMPGSNCGCW